MANSPLQIEIVAHVMGSMNHCSHCQLFIDGVGVGGQVKQTDLAAYPQEFMDDWQRLSDWVINLSRRYPHQLVIKITDAQSPQALWLALRHGVRKYPTFMVKGEKFQGWEAEANFIVRLNQLLAECDRPISAE